MAPNPCVDLEVGCGGLAFVKLDHMIEVVGMPLAAPNPCVDLEVGLASL